MTAIALLALASCLALAVTLPASQIARLRSDPEEAAALIGRHPAGPSGAPGKAGSPNGLWLPFTQAAVA